MLRMESFVPVASADTWDRTRCMLMAATSHRGSTPDLGTSRRLLSLRSKFGRVSCTNTGAPT